MPPTRSRSHSLLLICLFFLILPLLCTAQDDQLCNDAVAECDPETDYFEEKITIAHASTTIADLKYSNTFVEFAVITPATEFTPEAKRSYRLVKCGCDPGDTPNSVQVLFTNPSRVCVSETPTLSIMNALLPDLESLAYTGPVTTIYEQKILDLIDDKKVTALEDPSTEDPETTKTIFDPLEDDDELSLIIMGSFQAPGYEEREIGKKYLVIGEVNEISPLARAEWMKVIGLLFDLSKEANEKFAGIEKTYEETKKLAAGAQRRPSVFFNSPFVVLEGYNPDLSPDENFEWYQPSQKTYLVAIVKDANADYRFSLDGNAGSSPYTFTAIKENFSTARFLINTGGFPPKNDLTLKQFIEQPFPGAEDDDSFQKTAKNLTAVRCGNVWSNQKRINGEANDYFDSLAFQPDKFLTELVHIFHPYLGKTDDGDLFYSYNLGDASEDIVGSKCPFPDLTGPAGDGKQYVDHKFMVADLDRFDIEDQMQDKILSDLREALNVDESSVDVLFTAPHNGDKKGTPMTVRILANEDQVDEMDDSDKVLKSLRSSIGDGVSVVEEADKDDDGGGLGGGAIFGIVLAVLVVLGVIGYLVFRNRKKGQVPVAGGDGGEWETENVFESGPTGAV